VTIIPWEELVRNKSGNKEPVALTIGVFDGIHTGHRKLLDAIINNPHGARPVVVTFRENPARILKGWNFPGDISTLNQKLARLDFFGIQGVVLIDFSMDFSKMTGGDFFDVLFDNFIIKKVAAGQNFFFGHNKDTDVPGLKKLLGGIELEIVNPQEYDGKVVSSSRIRKEIRNGNFEDVREMLKNEYALDLSKISLDWKSDNRFLMDQGQTTQILPVEGDYKGRITGKAVDIPCDIKVGNGKLEVFIDRRNVDKRETDILCFSNKAYERR
jgi:FAD synthase